MSHGDMMAITDQLDHALAEGRGLRESNNLLQQQIDHQAQSIDGYQETINDLETQRDEMRALLHGAVPVMLSRDNALMLAGWIQAHRPPGDWEPEFLGVALRALAKAVNVPDPEGDEEPF